MAKPLVQHQESPDAVFTTLDEAPPRINLPAPQVRPRRRIPFYALVALAAVTVCCTVSSAAVCRSFAPAPQEKAPCDKVVNPLNKPLFMRKRCEAHVSQKAVRTQPMDEEALRPTLAERARRLRKVIARVCGFTVLAVRPGKLLTRTAGWHNDLLTTRARIAMSRVRSGCIEHRLDDHRRSLRHVHRHVSSLLPKSHGCDWERTLQHSKPCESGCVAHEWRVRPA